MKRLIRYDDIYGMATIGRHENPNFLVAVNPDTNRFGDCYFKYYDDKSFDSAKRVTRLSFTAPVKVKHRNRDGKQEWDLNTKDRKNLCNYLDEPSKDYRLSGLTNWVMALYHCDNECGLLSDDYPEEYSNKVDAFLHGFYDTEENITNPNYLVSTLSRPDYTQVEN